MSTTYRTVSWNPLKRRYDLVAAGLILAFITVVLGVQAVLRPELTIETLLIRALGAAAFTLLHVVLCIGPLSRLDRRFLPLLYNRRHLGVMMFTLAFAHGVFSIVQFHAGGTLNPLVSVLVSNARYDAVNQLPFQPFGLAALVILFVMAATSHDFWLHNLTAPVWKRIHMAVYVAYMLIVLHVIFGVLQGEASRLLAWLLCAGALAVFTVHALAARQEAQRDRENTDVRADGFVDVCAAADIPEKRAVITCLSGERVAVFRYDGRISAISNVCQHQNGPLGEGRIVNGCVVCPWHGYEYLPDSGASPPPFTEKVPTFNVRVDAGRVLVHPRPHPPGNRVEPATLTATEGPDVRTREKNDEFFIGYAPPMPPALARFVSRVVIAIGCLAIVCAVALAAGHLALEGGTFEFGHPQRVAGTIVERPYPALRLDRADPNSPLVLLVAPGKHGADALVKGLDGRHVTLAGTRIHRGPHSMIEMEPASLVSDQDSERARGVAPLEARVAGHVALTGEIVDSKCFLGVMVPGSGKTHKDCASLCLRGGIPPALYVQDRSGASSLLLLTGPSGEPIGRPAPQVAGEAISVTGSVHRQDGWHVLRTDPSNWRPLDR